MSADTGRLETDRLFKGLTRPPMVFGVSFMFFFLNIVTSFMAYMTTNNLAVLIGMIAVMHAIGYIVCFKEPLFLDLLIVKAQKCTRCTNRMYHGANSYDVN